MTAPTPYLYFPGTAREALTFYAATFGGQPQLHTFAEFGRTDGPQEAVAHGYLVEGPVAMFAADTFGDQPALSCTGMMFSLLGTASPTTMRAWFDGLADGGHVIDDLRQRPWGAFDGQVVDRYGLHWLVGYEPDDEDATEADQSVG